MGSIAVYPGSFDPLHNGHLSVIRRGVRVFDKVIVAVATNIGKHPLFSIDERLNIVQREFAAESRVEVSTFDGLVVAYAQSVGANVLLRGLRAVSDFEYELQMANMNRSLSTQVETLFMMSEDHQSYISSRLIKEVASLGGSVQNQVPGLVNELLIAKFAQRDGGEK